MFHRHVLLLICLLAAVAAPPARGQAAERPPLRQLLAGAVYRERFERAVANGPSLAELEASGLPAVGLFVWKIVPDSQAERLGIVAGDVLTHIDDAALWSYTADMPRRPSEQVLTWITAEGVQRRDTIGEGLIGTWYNDYRRPDLAYIRGNDRDAAYDREIIVALRTCRTDPDLAETALWHAVQQGCKPGELTDSLAALIALYQGRLEVAEAFVQRLPAPDVEHPFRSGPELRGRIALALGRYERLLELARHNPERVMDPQVAERIVTLWREQGAQPPPAPGALGAEHDRVLLAWPERVGPIDDDQLLGRPNQADEIHKRDVFHFHAAPANFENAYFGVHEPTPDVELVMHFRLAAPRQRHRYLNTLEILMLDGQYRRRHGLGQQDGTTLQMRSRQKMLAINLARVETGDTYVYLGGVHEEKTLVYDEPLIDLDPMQPAELEVRITRVGPWGQITLNGKTVATLPVEAEVTHPAVMLFVVGADARIDKVDLYELKQP